MEVIVWSPDNPKEKETQNFCTCEMHHMMILQQFFLPNNDLLKLKTVWSMFSQPTSASKWGITPRMQAPADHVCHPGHTHRLP